MVSRKVVNPRTGHCALVSLKMTGMQNTDSAHIAIRIRRPADEVYRYIRTPENLPRWAAGLSGKIEERDGIWWSDSPMGEVQVQFVEENPYRLVDHRVRLPDGQEVLNPMRVFEHPEGCEVLFSIWRRSDMSEDDFERDRKMVQTDLATLKQVLESVTLA